MRLHLHDVHVDCQGSLLGEPEYRLLCNELMIVFQDSAYAVIDGGHVWEFVRPQWP